MEEFVRDTTVEGRDQETVGRPPRTGHMQCHLTF